MSERDVIADFLGQRYGDGQAYRGAEVLLGRLHKAGLRIGPDEDSLVMELAQEIEQLRTAVRNLQKWNARLDTGDDQDEEDAFQSYYEGALQTVLALDVSGGGATDG